jgi:hypothetical protein
MGTMSHHPAIQFIAPYRIYVPDEFFRVLIGSIAAHVKAVPLPPAGVAGASQIHGQNVEIVHDIFGFGGRTQFYVVLGETVDVSDSSWTKTVCARDGEFVEAALRAVNRLLAVYRDLDVNRIGVRSFHVIELVRGDLSDISLIVVDDELDQFGDFAITWPSYRTVGVGQAIMRDVAVIDAIRAQLASGSEISIERELLTSAQNHLWRRQLRLVPVEANMAFESYAYSALKRAAPSNTLPDSSDVFKKLQELDAALAAAASIKSKQFIRWFDATMQGWKGLRSVELREWHGNCYALRNKVIHRGYNAVTAAEADVAIKNTRAAIAMIDECVTGLVE